MENSVTHPSKPNQVSVPAIIGGQMVLIAAQKHPFRAQRVLTELPAGASVAELLCAIGLDAAIPARVDLDGSAISFGRREHAYPRAGQTLTIRVIPSGGDRGKNAELITIAIAAVAAAVTYGAGAALAAPAAAGAGGATAGATSASAGGILAPFSVGSVQFAGLGAISAQSLLAHAFAGALAGC
jgi:hypothetical protein